MGQDRGNYIIFIQISLRFLNLFVFTISENHFRTYKLQMPISKNDNHNQNNISDINVKLHEIMALAKEIEQLSKDDKG
jgi:hypothetical protein